MKIVQFMKDWTLIIAILSGILGYFAYVSIPFLDSTHQIVSDIVAVLQPLLIFFMLFLTFCRINPRHLRLSPWHGWLLLIQGGLFTVGGLLLAVWTDCPARVELEGAMICLICPTATASAVIVKKLDGSVAAVTTYLVLINLLVAIIVPILAPWAHPQPGINVLAASAMILAKVFPLLLLPLIAALLVRYLSPKLHFKLTHLTWLSFYLWAVALSLAIAVTVRSIVHSSVPVSTMWILVAISLVCCIFQFWAGRKIGAKYGDKITAGQALGQKNTVLAIWMGYTFFSPVTAMCGGFYSIWHNVINSWQLYEHKKKEQQARQ